MLTYGTTDPVPGRRVLATPMHDPIASGIQRPQHERHHWCQPARIGRLAGDFVPARRAMTHQTVNTNGNEAVRERYLDHISTR